jgi:outer membrane murein-binding lipoprotein Lpp
MRISALILGSLVALGCSNAANKKLDEFADRACACKEAECGQKVMEDFLQWAKDNKDARGDEGAAKKAVAKMQGCITKLSAKMRKPAEGKPAEGKPAEGKPAEGKPAE